MTGRDRQHCQIDHIATSEIVKRLVDPGDIVTAVTSSVTRPTISASTPMETPDRVVTAARQKPSV